MRYCDFCGSSNSDFKIASYGSQHYNRIICKQCIIKIVKEDLNDFDLKDLTDEKRVELFLKHFKPN